MTDTPTIMIVDDDEGIRDSLAVLLETSGYQTEAFDRATGFLDTISPETRGVVILDVRMPGMGGLELQEHLRSHNISLPVIVITGHADVPMAVRAMQAGAHDFIQKPFEAEVILESLERAVDALNRSSQDEDFVRHALAGVERLTPRERDVLEQLVIGHPNKVIAYELGLSPRTVEIHRARVMEKLEARNLSHLVRMALAAGVEPPP